MLEETKVYLVKCFDGCVHRWFFRNIFVGGLVLHWYSVYIFGGRKSGMVVVGWWIFLVVFSGF